MSLYSDTPSILPDDQKPLIYNSFWRNNAIINDAEHLTIQKAYELERQRKEKLHDQMREIVENSIPSGKYILFVNSTSRGIVGSAEFDFIDKDRQDQLFEIETGSKEIQKQEFIDRNIAYCIGLSYGDPRLRFFHSFSDDINTIDWSLCVGVIFSGSEINVHETDREHELALQRVFSIIEQSHHLPRLGICFGAQAIAHSFGSKVTWVVDSNGNRKITSGIEKITQTPKSALSTLGQVFYAAENHAQGIKTDVTSDKKFIVMAESDLGYVEIFQAEKTLGVQFHPEVSLARIDIAKSISGKPVDLNEIFNRDLNPISGEVFSYFLHLVKSTILLAKLSRPLFLFHS